MCTAQLVAALRRDRPALAFFPSTPEKLQQKRCVTFSPPLARHRAFEGLKIMGQLREFTHSQAQLSLFSQVGGEGEETIFSMAAHAVSSRRREVTPAIHHHYRFPRKWRRGDKRGVKNKKKSWDNEISTGALCTGTTSL